MLHTWLNDLKIYFHPRVAIVGLLGFFSGLPLMLTASTLTYWLATAQIDYKSIGLMAIVGLPYAIKFTWAPFVDNLKIPFLTSLLGQRRSWMVLAQLGIIASLIGFAFSDPTENLSMIALCAFGVALFSATQDIAIDAYRIETLEPSQYAAGSAIGTFGYRMAMLVSGAGSILFADTYGWSACYIALSLLMSLGLIAVLSQHEPFRLNEETMQGDSLFHKAAIWISQTVKEPFTNFMQQPKWFLLLVFVLLYKASDAMLGFMAMPFYKAMGFTAGEIASAVKVFGLIATLFGAFLGGVLASHYGNLRMLFVAAILQALSNGVYILIFMAGHDVTVLYAALLIENITGGIATTAYVAYLCQLCSVRFAATQYALLSALAGTPRIFLAPPAGYIIDNSGWLTYFSTTIAVGIPAIILAWYFYKREPLAVKTA